jgi:hypothetical protein
MRRPGAFHSHRIPFPRSGPCRQATLNILMSVVPPIQSTWFGLIFVTMPSLRGSYPVTCLNALTASAVSKQRLSGPILLFWMCNPLPHSRMRAQKWIIKWVANSLRNLGLPISLRSLRQYDPTERNMRASRGPIPVSPAVVL